MVFLLRTMLLLQTTWLPVIGLLSIIVQQLAAVLLVTL